MSVIGGVPADRIQVRVAIVRVIFDDPDDVVERAARYEPVLRFNVRQGKALVESRKLEPALIHMVLELRIESVPRHRHAVADPSLDRAVQAEALQVA